MAYDDLEHTRKFSSIRTMLSFQRTRMSADRTLMAVLRTSLSMIGFGFTIYTFFSSLASKRVFDGSLEDFSPARLGLSLITLGVLLLGLGIANHINYMKMLRGQRRVLVDAELMDAADQFPVSLALIVAFLLLLIGLLAILAIIVRAYS